MPPTQGTPNVFENYSQMGVTSAQSAVNQAAGVGAPEQQNPFYNQYNANMAQYQNQMAQNAAAAQNAQQWKFQVL